MPRPSTLDPSTVCSAVRPSAALKSPRGLPVPGRVCSALYGPHSAAQPAAWSSARGVMRACVASHVCARMRVGTCVRLHVCAPARPHAHVCARTPACTPAHARACAHARPRTRPHARTHARRHAHTRTHAHPRMSTVAQASRSIREAPEVIEKSLNPGRFDMAWLSCNARMPAASRVRSRPASARPSTPSSMLDEYTFGEADARRSGFDR